MDMIEKMEILFASAHRHKPNLGDDFVTARKGLLEVPLIQMKDHVDYLIGFLEEMLPSFEKDYHPQEPDRDPLEPIRENFR